MFLFKLLFVRFSSVVVKTKQIMVMELILPASYENPEVEVKSQSNSRSTFNTQA